MEFRAVVHILNLRNNTTLTVPKPKMYFREVPHIVL